MRLLDGVHRHACALGRTIASDDLSPSDRVRVGSAMTGDVDRSHGSTDGPIHPSVRQSRTDRRAVRRCARTRAGADQLAARSLGGLGAGLRNVPRSMRRISAVLLTTGIVIASRAAGIRGAPEMRP